MTDNIYIVIPCFNEAVRFQPDQASILIDAGISLVMVDDGSTDKTWEVLSALQNAHPGAVQCLSMAGNVGKAEAVRQGLEFAVQKGATIVGYLDADFATPATEMQKMVDVIEQDKAIQVLLGSRWLHLGANIQRKMMRHYAGRIFATFASLVLDLKVYDTQCGAKLFRVSENFTASIDAPFISRWAFDVELIGRLRQGLPVTAFREEPLQEWIDVQGSKLTLLEMIQATLYLAVIWRALRSRQS